MVLAAHSIPGSAKEPTEQKRDTCCLCGKPQAGTTKIPQITFFYLQWSRNLTGRVCSDCSSSNQVVVG